MNACSYSKAVGVNPNNVWHDLDTSKILPTLLHIKWNVLFTWIGNSKSFKETLLGRENVPMKQYP